jgi:sphingomyelin phosphodiesterase 2
MVRRWMSRLVTGLLGRLQRVLSFFTLSSVKSKYSIHMYIICILSLKLFTNSMHAITQLFAKGGEDGPEYNRAHRLVNAWEFAKLARQAAEMGRYVIAVRLLLFLLKIRSLFFPQAGDFNSIPTTLPITVIREHAALSDSWLVTHPNQSSSSVSSPVEAINNFGVTADSPLNSYTAGKPLDPHARQFWGKRLDYIMYRQPHRPYATPDQTFPVIRSTECKVIMTGKVPGSDFSFSDHFGLEATLTIEVPERGPNADRPTSNAGSTTPPPTSELSNASIATVIQALTSCYRFSRMRAKRELLVFGLCLLILLAITIGTSWLPRPWINPIFLIFTIFIAWLATTILYEGFLYGNWECNALMNVIEELEIYRKGLDIQSGNPRNSGRF